MIDVGNILESHGTEKAEAVLKAASDDIPSMILDYGWFVTKDEHNHDAKTTIPNKPHLRLYLTELCNNQFVVVTKSRQIMITWGTLAYLLARALTRRNQLIIVQTKREEDAESLMDRTRHLYDNLPRWLRDIRPRLMPPRQSTMKLEIPKMDSMIWGIPQGADIIRSNTVSILFSDETDFQPEAAASLRAAAPSLVGGGQGIWVSTPTLDGLTRKLIKGSWS